MLRFGIIKRMDKNKNGNALNAAAVATSKRKEKAKACNHSQNETPSNLSQLCMENKIRSKSKSKTQKNKSLIKSKIVRLNAFIRYKVSELDSR